MLTATLFFSLGAILTAAIARHALPLGRRLGVMDFPVQGNGHKGHPKPTPAVGGVIAGLVAALIFVASLRFSAPGGYPFLHHRSYALAAILLTMLIGFLDDRNHIPAMYRLIFGIVISWILLINIPELIVDALYFPSLDLRFALGPLGLPFTILCLAGLKNAVNMADGRNGLLLGLALIWSVFFMFHAPPPMMPTLSGVTGCLVALFLFNARGKLFMGDCGSYGISLYYGLLALSLHEGAYGAVRSSEVILLFLVPVLDMARLVVSRILRGRSPFSPGGDHLHHLLENWVGWKRGWFIYMSLVGLPLVAYQVFHGYGLHLIAVASLAYALTVRASSGAFSRGSDKRRAHA